MKAAIFIIGVCFLFPAGLFANNQEIVRLKALLSTSVGEPEEAAIYARIGMLYTESNMDSTLHYGTVALDLSRMHDNQATKARSLSVLAFYYMERGNSYLSYKFAQEALTIFQQLGLMEQEAEMTMNIGVMLLKEGKVTQANQHLESALALSQYLERDSIQSLILLNTVLPRHQEIGVLELEQHLQKIEDIANRHTDRRVQLILQHFRTIQKLRNAPPSEELRSEIEALLFSAQHAGHDYLAIPGLMELGRAYLHIDQATSLRYIDSALFMAEKAGFVSLQMSLLNHAFHMLTSLQPVPDQANLYAESLQELTRMRMIEHQKDGLGFLEIAMREQELEVQQREVQIRHMWSRIVAVSGILGLLVALWAYWQYRAKRRLARRLEQTSAELTHKNLQLEANDHFNTRLISVLSHDLRHPFTSVLMMSGDLLSELDPAEQQIVYQDIQRSAAMSLQVIDGLLHWMKLQSISLADTPAALGIRDNMEKAVSFYEYEINRCQLSIQIAIDPQLEVLAQPEMLLFVNRNIISNALKYSPRGGTILVEAELHQDGRLVVSISDEGPGLTEMALRHVFSKDQKSMMTKDAQHGAGLAMIICHEMIVGMGGQIHARNRSDRPGAIFEYDLPLWTGGFQAEVKEKSRGSSSDKSALVTE